MDSEFPSCVTIKKHKAIICVNESAVMEGKNDQFGFPLPLVLQTATVGCFLLNVSISFNLFGPANLAYTFRSHQMVSHHHSYVDAYECAISVDNPPK